MEKKVQFTIVIFLTGIALVLLLGGLRKEKIEKNKIAEQAIAYNIKHKEREDKINAIEQAIYKDTPGIIVWGDSLTAGSGGEGTNYPDVLQRLIKTNIYNIPVVNMGVGGEHTHTIMGRAGSVPFVVDSFTIPKDTSKVEIIIKSSNGNNVFPLRQGNKGFNPVTINGITGAITIEQSSYTSQEFTYYFNRTESGNPVHVADGTIVTSTSWADYQNYIPIVFMGQNGGWNENPEELIAQIKSILSMDKWNDKYLVLGLTSGIAESRAVLESAMESEFGDQYINLRKYIVESGLEIVNLEATAEDVNAINEGSIPLSLLSDPIHFNSLGYIVIGQAIYDRMMKLGYFNSVIELVKERERHYNCFTLYPTKFPLHNQITQKYTCMLP